MNNRSTYKNNLKNILQSLVSGLKITFSHFIKSRKQAIPKNISQVDYFENYQEGIQTVQYPHEIIPVPDNGRYRLDNEIDDCIVCDKCAKICPVDCITIEPIKDTEVYGYTSDGTPKRIHAAKFDINMAQCCFCGLCTTVCPTECLTMTKTFDFSEYDFEDHIYSFANLSDKEIEEKRKALQKPETPKETPQDLAPEESQSKPVIKPKAVVKPAKPKVKPRINPPKKD
ncbi:MAG: 4Fe-4S dicluster domain-containing protein [Candidatus Cyclobacteriaceae bacterium M2_1C_046]